MVGSKPCQGDCAGLQLTTRHFGGDTHMRAVEDMALRLQDVYIYGMWQG